VTRTIRIVIQARMNSSRLPGKIAADIAGRPMLAYTIGRLQAAAERCVLEQHRWEIAVATTMAPEDDVVERLCESLGAGCYRGSERDVLARYAAASIDLAPDDTLIRATGDNPLYCPQRSAAIVAEHLRRGADYTCIENLSYVVPEVMQVGAFRQMAERASDAYCREHVTPYFRRADCEFRVAQLPQTWRGLRPEVRLTVDTPPELTRIRRLLDALDGELLAPLTNIYDACDGELERLATACDPAAATSKAAA
jgi:spore coat polysaccharide biosynthesis protein SpsF